MSFRSSIVGVSNCSISAVLNCRGVQLSRYPTVGCPNVGRSIVGPPGLIFVSFITPGSCGYQSRDGYASQHVYNLEARASKSSEHKSQMGIRDGRFYVQGRRRRRRHDNPQVSLIAGVADTRASQPEIGRSRDRNFPSRRAYRRNVDGFAHQEGQLSSTPG